MAKGRSPERKYTGPPGYWGFSVGLTTPWPPSKSTTVTETQMKHQTVEVIPQQAVVSSPFRDSIGIT